MQIRVYTIDVKVSRWAKRAMLFGVIPTLLLGLVAAVVAQPPATFSDNEVLSAAKTNGNFSNLQAQITNLVPVGTVVAFSGPIDGNPGSTGATNLPPTGWLYCNGDAVSRTQSPGLFATITIAHGGGDGVATFNLPDYRGRFLRGVDGVAARDPNASERLAANPGGNTGNKVGTIEADLFSSHDHGGGVHTHTATTGSAGGHTHNLGIGLFHWQAQPGASWIYYVDNVSPGQTTASAGAHLHDIAVDNSSTTIPPSGGGETRPKNANVNYVIKY